MLVKYPKTPHLMFSEKATSDDRILKSHTHFNGKRVIVSIKMDGESTSLYSNYSHARSLDSANHPSRNWIKGFHAQWKYLIPEGWRVCGENLYATHTIHYEHLPSYFLVYNIWNENNVCLDWNTTLELCKQWELKTVPIIYDGQWNEEIIRSIYQPEINGDPCEGFVVRLYESFKFEDFDKSVAKFVSGRFKINPDEHWMDKKITPNKLGE